MSATEAKTPQFLQFRSMAQKKHKSILEHRGWGILFSYVLQYRKEVLLISLLGLISAVANGSVPVPNR